MHKDFLNTLQAHKYLIALLLVCVAGASQAQKLRWYDVEVVVFSHQRGEYLNTETWPKEWAQPETEQALDFDTVKHSLFSKKLPQGDLAGAAKRIDSSSRYQLLSYKAWRQAGLSKARTKPVLIRSEETISAQVPAGTDEEGNPISNIIEVPQLDGSITIELGRFLHIYTDLLYQAPVETIEIISATDPETEPEISYRLATQGSESAHIQGFELKAHRKTRSKETQFIDHPMFGLIVRITPVQTS